MNKPELTKKIKEADFLNNEEKTALIELLNQAKRYGLVWEEKAEDAEELLRDYLPVLKEVPEKRITGSATGKNERGKPQPDLFNDPIQNEDTSPKSGNYPNHILIEGDNLHALTALSFTHEGKVDVIYIDPPYNTGNKDFRYNDAFVDREDAFKHSKWLSFIGKRLKIAKRLLNKNGIIFTSIDNNEQFQLKLLCDEIFGESGFVSCIAVVNNFSGRSDDKFIATAHEGLLIYRMPSFETLGVQPPDEYIEEYNIEDETGKYRLQGLRKRGSGAKREDRPNMYYPFYYNPSTNHLTIEKPRDIGYQEILPKLSDGTDGRWRWGRDTASERINELQVNYVKKRREFDINQKDYLNRNGALKRIKPKSIWLGSNFSSDFATTQFKEIVRNSSFNYPKSTDLIKYCLEQSAKKESIILDFFAGSGTTLHATMQLNAEDGGNRQCILVTNNENNICEEVTYERNKRVIEGYTNSKGERVEGLAENNLRYFKTEFVGRERSLKNKRKITELSVDLLRIKEDCYTEIEGAKHIRVFNEKELFVVVVADDIAIPKAVELLKHLPASSKIKVYVFSEEQDPYTEDFYEVLNSIELCALPDAIYKAYRHVLPRKKAIHQEEESTIGNSSN